MPARESMPSTIKRSPKGAKETWAKTYDSALDQYGEGSRARRVAYSSLKHSYEKVGDHWEQKDGKGPSDEQAEQGGTSARDNPKETAGGVDANASKQHLYDITKRLDVNGRSKMTKTELVEAIQRANDRETARARSS
jgi:cation transport regulator ChaB